MAAERGNRGSSPSPERSGGQPNRRSYHFLFKFKMMMVEEAISKSGEKERERSGKVLFCEDWTVKVEDSHQTQLHQLVRVSLLMICHRR